MSRFNSRFCSFIVAVVMVGVIIPISLVNAQTKTLTAAILKTSKATSVESNGKFSLAFKAKGLSEQDQEQFAFIGEMLDNLQVDFNTKLSGNNEGTISRQYAKMSINVAGSPYSGELWSDINLTGKTPIVKGIVKSPQIFEMMLPPEYMNKYMLLDFEQIKKMPEMQTELGSMDFGKMMSENKELQQLILTIFEKYSSQLGLDYSLVSNNGNVYKVKIDDAQFKDIIRKVVNLTAKNKENQNLILDLIITEMKNSGASTEEINSTKVDMNQMFTTLESQEFLDKFNQMMDKLQDVKILGDNGIDITYTLDENGYVISTKGDMEFVADMAMLDKAFGESAAATASESIPKGIYTVGMHFEVNNSNINGKVNIDMPTITSENSFNIQDLNDEPLPEIITDIKELNDIPKAQIVAHTVKGGKLPNTSTHLYDILLIGVVLSLVGAIGWGWTSRKRYE
ncbi:MAG: hypothetical protein ACREVX_13460 [Clostridium sp.]|uniref:hypothetical protein n=1 Tax=Clostridium sp. TaxID=1506 RepID=UPI003D6C9409